MDKPYPHSILIKYADVADSLIVLHDIIDDVSLILEAIAGGAEAQVSPATLAALALAAKAYLAVSGEALMEIGDYCRAADVHYTGRSDRPSLGGKRQHH